MKTSIIRMALIIALPAILLIGSTAIAKTVDLPDGSKLDLEKSCPVCGMKASAGALGPSAVVFKDGEVVATDGPRDLMRYVKDPKKYGVDTNRIKAIYVTDYSTKKVIDAKKSYYVIGSDVTGAMGKAPIPFADQAAAEKFSKEQNGEKVVSFEELSLEDVAPKRKMLKMKHGHGGSGSKSK